MNGSKRRTRGWCGNRLLQAEAKRSAHPFSSREICAISFKQFVADFNDRAPFQLNWLLWVCTPRTVDFVVVHVLAELSRRQKAAIGSRKLQFIC
jgi:hypothetical protein